MNQSRYTDEFKAEAVKQVVERGHRRSDVANRLGFSKWSLHQWLSAHLEQQPEAAHLAARPYCAFIVSGTHTGEVVVGF
jgi:transposase